MLRFQRGHIDRLETLHPAYFAMVMATGIVAIAAMLNKIPVLPTVLFWLNAGLFSILLGATIARAIIHPSAFAADIQSHSRGVGFVTIVAAFGVFGSELVVQMGAAKIALIFWIIAAGLWFVVTYGILAVLMVTPDKPRFADGVNGGWLVIVVATQAISVLTILILPGSLPAAFHAPMMFAALILWLCGGAIYMWLITILVYRFIFLPMPPQDITPPFWINMGAVAISSLAGATLLHAAPLSPVISDIAPFVEGFTLLFWAIGSWWIPILLAFGIWRYILCGVPLAYDPLYWGGVFPLGMYSVCTHQLAEMLGLSYLASMSYVVMLLSLLAWLATFIGLIDSRLRA